MTDKNEECVDCSAEQIAALAPRRCGCCDDTLSRKVELLNNARAMRIQDNGQAIRIGVIFHICYSNPNRSTIQSDIDYAIDMLNRDYNKRSTNFDIGKNIYTQNTSFQATYNDYVSRAVSCNLHFHVVNVIYTPLARQTSSNIHVLDANIKGASPPVQPEKYLNVWVVDFSNGLLGYAQFPWDDSPSTDGVIIAKGTFGRRPEYTQYNLSKTLAHEVGHWLGLYHTFQDTFNYGEGLPPVLDGGSQEFKGDCVEDTPPQKDPTYGNPFNNPNTWPASRPIDENSAHRHMFMNFMDYSDDAALFMFTKDQADKLRQMIFIYRPDIIESEEVPETPIEPEIPRPKLLRYDFEKAELGEGFIGNIRFIDGGVSNSAGFTNARPHQGQRSGASNYRGSMELVVNLTGASKATLSFYYLSRHPNACIWVQVPGSTQWYRGSLPATSEYKNIQIVLPQPEDLTMLRHYRLRFGTNSMHSQYAFFDTLEIMIEY